MPDGTAISEGVKAPPLEAFRLWLKQPALDHLRRRAVRGSQSLIMSIFRAVLLLGIVYVILSPCFKIISNSVKAPADIYNPLVYLIPETFTLENIEFAIKYMDYFPALIQTLSFTLGIAALQVLVTSMTGYGFARFRIPGGNVLFALVILTIVIPIQTYMVPMYMQFRYFKIFGFEFNLIGRYMSVILLTATGVGLRSGLYIYIFRQFFKGLPKEIEDAALIDGAGQFRTYFLVMLPNAAPAIITVIMFALVWQYNDTFYASYFMPTVKLLALKLTAMPSTFSVIESVRDPNLVELVVNASIVLMIAPLITVYLIMQGYFMEGIERSGIVG